MVKKVHALVQLVPQLKLRGHISASHAGKALGTAINVLLKKLCTSGISQLAHPHRREKKYI